MKKAYSSILVVATLLSACGGRPGGPGGFGGGGMGDFAMPVSAAPLTRGDIVQTFTVTGSVTPLLSASLSSVVSGTVLEVNAQIGQRVSKGDLLVKIDDSTLRAQLEQGRAALESARARLAQTRANDTGNVASMDAGLSSAKVAASTAHANLKRNEMLFRQGFVSQSVLEQSQQQAAAADAALRSAWVSSQNAQLNPNALSAAMADMHNAQAAVDQSAAAMDFTAAQIAQTNVRAPFDGVVVSRAVDPGSLAAPGTTLMEVAQLDPVYVNAGIAGTNLAFVHVGTPTAITVATIPGRSWTGKIQYLNLSSVPGTLTYLARIPIANADAALRGGMVANVSFEQARKAGVIIAPRAAVFQTDAGFAMFVMDASGCPPPLAQAHKVCAKSVPVEVGLENDQQMEVTGPGLKPGMQAILNHSALLQPGTPVMALPPQGNGRPTQGKQPAQGKSQSSQGKS